MKVIGLTGGIASGKSAVTNILKKRFNFVVIDADQLARQAVAVGSPGLEKIIDGFGKDILTEAGELNRFKLGEIIANDDQARKKLNGIVHPEVQKIYNQEIRIYENKGMPVIIYDCPLLFEANLQNTVDQTILVVADKEIRIKRIMERDGLNREQAQKRIDMQMPDAEKIALADVIIENNGSLDDLLISLDLYLSNRKPWA
ncbi:MAG: dephospho-CoA kinase [Firmicutes bacterium]|nr:dephospho-CoA kinase [Bacillota bacterium]